jgi:hypothetical protein
MYLVADQDAIFPPAFGECLSHLIRGKRNTTDQKRKDES